MYNAIDDLKKYANEDTMLLRFLQTLAMIAIFLTFVLLSPVYILFGGQVTDKLGRPALFTMIFLMAIGIVLGGMMFYGLI